MENVDDPSELADPSNSSNPPDFTGGVELAAGAGDSRRRSNIAVAFFSSPQTRSRGAPSLVTHLTPEGKPNLTVFGRGGVPVLQAPHSGKRCFVWGSVFRERGPLTPATGRRDDSLSGSACPPPLHRLTFLTACDKAER